MIGNKTMSNSKIDPSKITKPFQLAAAWFATPFLVVSAFLTAATQINSPGWVVPALVIAAIVFPFLCACLVYRLQTKYRFSLLGDAAYLSYIYKRPISEAVRYEKPDLEGKNLREIKFNETKPFEFNAIDNEDLLFLRARIHYRHEAGSTQLMRIKVNGKTLKGPDLINQQLYKKIADGRKHFWFNDDLNAWSVCYSPNFKQNYYHKAYRVINGDPYTYMFNLSRIGSDKENKYRVEIEHIGGENEAFQNSIIAHDVKIL